MYPVINLLQTNTLYYKDQLLSSLTPQQKQILAIAMAALSFIATLCLVRRCYFTAKSKEVPNDPVEKEGLKERIIPQTKPKEEPEEAQSKKEVELEKREVELEEKEEVKLEEKEEVELEEKEEIKLEKEEAEPEEKAKAELEEEIPRDEKIRNVLIIGASRTGKTTLRNVLENLCYVAPEMSIFSSTLKPKLHPPMDLGGYTFRVLDTPGLCETAPIGKTARGNAEIVQLIEKKVKKHFGGKNFENVDAAIMTFSVTQGFTSEDIESLNTFIPKLDPKTKKILLVTRAESYNQTWRNQVRDEISQHPKLAELIATHFQGKENILFSGSLDNCNVKSGESIEWNIRRIHADRESLIKALLPVEEPADLKAHRLKTLAVQANAFLDAQAASQPAEEEQPEEGVEVEAKSELDVSTT